MDSSHGNPLHVLMTWRQDWVRRDRERGRRYRVWTNWSKLALIEDMPYALPTYSSADISIGMAERTCFECGIQWWRKFVGMVESTVALTIPLICLVIVCKKRLEICKDVPWVGSMTTFWALKKDDVAPIEHFKTLSVGSNRLQTTERKMWFYLSPAMLEISPCKSHVH